jgi:hypothetical protein
MSGYYWNYYYIYYYCYYYHYYSQSLTEEKDRLVKEKEKLRSRLDKSKTQTDHVTYYESFTCSYKFYEYVHFYFIYSFVR